MKKINSKIKRKLRNRKKLKTQNDLVADYNKLKRRPYFQPHLLKKKSWQKKLKKWKNQI